MSLAAVNSGVVTIPQYILDDSPLLQKRLKTFNDAQARAKEATALVGTAEEIGHLRIQVEEELALATKLSADARLDADTVRNDASIAADKIMANANEAALKVTFMAEGVLKDAEITNTAANARDQDSRKAEGDITSLAEYLKTKEALLNKESEELDQLKQQLLAEQSVLATVREEIDKVLR